MIFTPGTRNIHFAMVVAIGGFQIFTWEMLGSHMKFQSLMVKLEISCIPKHCTPFKGNSLARSPPHHPPNPENKLF